MDVLLPMTCVDVNGQIVVYIVVCCVIVVIMDEDTGATELAGADEMVIVLCTVEVIVETVVKVDVDVMLPEVITVVSVHVVSWTVVAGMIVVE